MPLPAPNTFGLPDKFTSWYPYQDDAVTFVLDSAKRFPTEIMATGSGKSLMYAAAAHMMGARTAFLTSTKGLQAQVLSDFSSIGLVDIRGRNSYRCIRDPENKTRCDQGLCTIGVGCQHKSDLSCHYYAAYARARAANLVVTNYSYWMYQHAYGEGLGNFDLLVCDEAHAVPEIVSSFLTVKLDRRDAFMSGLLPKNYGEYNIEQWVDWARSATDTVTEEIQDLTDHIRDQGDHYIPSPKERSLLSTFRRLEKSLTRLRTMDDTWVWGSNKIEVNFSPIWPKSYCEDVLFLDVPQVTLTSATVCRKTLDLLGIPDDDIDLSEYPHPFPLEHRRLSYIPTVRMNHRATPDQIRYWLTRIDQIIGRRLDRKGIIHTVSYDRRNFVMANSLFSKHMVTHDSHNAEQVVRQFKNMPAPAILVSPSVTTGYDFPGDEAEYQIIGKIAYPDTRDKIVKARAKDDPEYPAYIAMQHLVQASGRITRQLSDFGETFIIDNNITWFLKTYKEFAPDWFKEAYKYCDGVPAAPKKEE